MSFLIDTDTCSAHLRGVAIVNNRFLQYTGGLHISAVSVAELKFWLYRRNTPKKYRQGLAPMMQDFTLLAADESVADRAGAVGADLLDRGLPIATPDLLIAATALVHNLTLVTHNTQDFANISGLSVADWLIPRRPAQRHRRSREVRPGGEPSSAAPSGKIIYMERRWHGKTRDWRNHGPKGDSPCACFSAKNRESDCLASC